MSTLLLAFVGSSTRVPDRLMPQFGRITRTHNQHLSTIPRLVHTSIRPPIPNPPFPQPTHIHHPTPLLVLRGRRIDDAEGELQLARVAPQRLDDLVVLPHARLCLPVRFCVAVSSDVSIRLRPSLFTHSTTHTPPKQAHKRTHLATSPLSSPSSSATRAWNRSSARVRACMNSSSAPCTSPSFASRDVCFGGWFWYMEWFSGVV